MVTTIVRQEASPAQTVAALLALLPEGTLSLRAAILHRAFFNLQALYGDLLPGLRALEFAQRPATTPISPQLDQILQILAGSTSSTAYLVHYHRHPRWSAPVAPDEVLVAAARDLQQFIDTSLQVSRPAVSLPS